MGNVIQDVQTTWKMIISRALELVITKEFTPISVVQASEQTTFNWNLYT